MFVDFNILNQLGSPSINSNTFANRPSAGQVGRLFVSTDTFEIYRDNGTTWDLIGGPGTSTVTGSGAATQLAYWTSSQAIGGSNNLWWDASNNRLGVNTNTPGAALDIHSTGVIAQFNTTSGTGNVNIAFQRNANGVWRFGDTYNGGNNYFELHNTVLTNNAIEVTAASNEALFVSAKTYTTGNAIGVAVRHNLTIPNGTNVGLAAIGGVNSNLNLSLGGSTTIANTGRQGLEGNMVIGFTGAGTLTMTQGSTLRAFSALSTVYAFNGSAVGTITHLAGIRVCFPDNVGSAVNITNNYGILINDQTTGLGTVTYTNRWGVYQEGASDINYFNGNLLIKSTVNSGEALQVNGSAKATNVIISEQVAPATPSASTGILYAKTDNLPYYKNDAGTEYSLTIPESQVTIALQSLGSQIKGFVVSNSSFAATQTQQLASQTLIFNAYYLPIGQVITGIKFFQQTQGVYTANNYNGVGLYSYSGGTLTLVASSTNDGNIWKGIALTWQTKAFSSTYNAAAGIYFVAALYSSSAQTTPPFLLGQTVYLENNFSRFDFTNLISINATLGSQTALPATQLSHTLNPSRICYNLFLY